MKHQAALVGIGSPHGDDAVGWHVVEGLRARLEPSIASHSCSASGLLTILNGYSVVWIVDACRAGWPLGAIRRMDWTETPRTWLAASSSHGLGVMEALTLLTTLGKLPRRVVLWMVEIGASLPGAEISPQIMESAARMQRQILRECQLLFRA